MSIRNSTELGDAVKEYRAGKKQFASKQRDLQALGADLVRLGEWLLRYDHDQIAKEPLLNILNVTEDVTLTMQVSYPPAQEVIDMVNTTNTLVTRLKVLAQDISE